MAHNTLNGGTVTEIGGGKALMNGTVYEVDSGKALSGGTVYPISFLSLPPKLALNDMTWEEIHIISDAGVAANYFSVGDRKGVKLQGTVGSLSLSGTYYCYIIGIDHNSSVEGSNRIHFQFGYTALSGGVHIAFIDSGYMSAKTSGNWFNMNNSRTCVGGWAGSRMKTIICPAFKNAMPSDLRAVLKTVTKYTDNVADGSEAESCVTATSEEVFLLAEYEVFGNRYSANAGEQSYQKRYAYYSNGNSPQRYRHSSTANTAVWWLRSPSVVYALTTNFCFGSENGGAGGVHANAAEYSRGFAPGFCV